MRIGELGTISINMRKIVVIGLALGAVLAPPVMAEEKGLGAQIDEALARALKQFEAMAERFPGYEAPEVTPEGDIIIRKKRPKVSTDDVDKDGRVKI